MTWGTHAPQAVSNPIFKSLSTYRRELRATETQTLQNTVLQRRGVDNEDQQRRRPKGYKVNASTGLQESVGHWVRN